MEVTEHGVLRGIVRTVFLVVVEKHSSMAVMGEDTMLVMDT